MGKQKQIAFRATGYRSCPVTGRPKQIQITRPHSGLVDYPEAEIEGAIARYTIEGFQFDGPIRVVVCSFSDTTVRHVCAEAAE